MLKTPLGPCPPINVLMSLSGQHPRPGGGQGSPPLVPDLYMDKQIWDASSQVFTWIDKSRTPRPGFVYLVFGIDKSGTPRPRFVDFFQNRQNWDIRCYRNAKKPHKMQLLKTKIDKTGTPRSRFVDFFSRSTNLGHGSVQGRPFRLRMYSKSVPWTLLLYTRS